MWYSFSFQLTNTILADIYYWITIVDCFFEKQLLKRLSSEQLVYPNSHFSSETSLIVNSFQRKLHFRYFFKKHLTRNYSSHSIHLLRIWKHTCKRRQASGVYLFTPPTRKLLTCSLKLRNILPFCIRFFLRAVFLGNYRVEFDQLVLCQKPTKRETRKEVKLCPFILSIRNFSTWGLTFEHFWNWLFLQCCFRQETKLECRHAVPFEYPALYGNETIWH